MNNALEDEAEVNSQAVSGEEVSAEVSVEPAAVTPEAASADEGLQIYGFNDAYVNMKHLRMAEALLFAAEVPMDEAMLASSLPEGADVPGLLSALERVYEKRGVNLVHVAGRWQFRTAPDLAYLLQKEKPEQKKLSRAAIETLSIIAYHQPVTRAEIEDIRGVAVSKGTLDALMEIGWVKIKGRKRSPGRPVTYGTTDEFLIQFGLEDVSLLPGMDELKAAGFLEAIPPGGFDMPEQLPDDDDDAGDDEAEEVYTQADLLEPPL